MKVLVFPALLAIAIVTSPPKPFAPKPTGPASAATATVQPAASANCLDNPNQALTAHR
ncbi:hypothetical protein [Hymenobacter pini]|uniref:hypothetical protein n=1 Tax=Hymenobacter pini TaxID=2880879 RepID=UPI001CF22427|nr:hypothetical protein [Hymenobacter pini]MCA8832395.1 hypothetical protein [Hymenobacter pini]